MFPKISYKVSTVKTDVLLTHNYRSYSYSFVESLALTACLKTPCVQLTMLDDLISVRRQKGDVFLLCAAFYKLHNFLSAFQVFLMAQLLAEPDKSIAVVWSLQSIWLPIPHRECFCVTFQEPFPTFMQFLRSQKLVHFRDFFFRNLYRDFGTLHQPKFGLKILLSPKFLYSCLTKNEK